MKKYKAWKSYAQFKAFATNVNDVELLSKIKNASEERTFLKLK